MAAEREMMATVHQTGFSLQEHHFGQRRRRCRRSLVDELVRLRALTIVDSGGNDEVLGEDCVPSAAAPCDAPPARQAKREIRYIKCDPQPSNLATALQASNFRVFLPVLGLSRPWPVPDARSPLEAEAHTEPAGAWSVRSIMRYGLRQPTPKEWMAWVESVPGVSRGPKIEPALDANALLTTVVSTLSHDPAKLEDAARAQE